MSAPSDLSSGEIGITDPLTSAGSRGRRKTAKVAKRPASSGKAPVVALKKRVAILKAPVTIRTRKVVKSKAPTAIVPIKTRPKAPPLAHDNATRASIILQDILTKNPTVQHFTVEKIVNSIGSTSFGTSLMVFALPEVLPIPIPGISAIVVLPTGVVSAQMAAGHRQITLPKFILERSVPRKALAAAIHAILPALKRAESVTKPRWEWATSPAAQRLLGVFIFVLAAAIAVPIPGFNMPQAIAIFIIGLGLVEKDGKLVCLGVVVGILSLILLGAVLFGLSSLLGF